MGTFQPHLQCFSKYGDSFAVKMPIAFPCLLTELILSQHPTILRDNEEEFPKCNPLNFDYRLFVGTHVKDIEILSAKESDHSGSIPGTVKENILSELIDTSKTLQETIRVCTERKLSIDRLIQQMLDEQEIEGAKDKAEEEEAAEDVNDEAAEEATNDERGSHEGEDEEEKTDEASAVRTRFSSAFISLSFDDNKVYS